MKVKGSLSQLRPKKLSEGSDEQIRRKQHVIYAHSWWECKIVQLYCGKVWQFFKQLSIKLPYDPAASLPGIYPQRTGGRYSNKYIHKQVPRGTIHNSQNWKQPKHPIDGMEYYSAVKKDKIVM